jgi:glycosyltransferase involved in cell wall biosynthesis
MSTPNRTTGGPVLLVTPRWTRDGGVGAHVQVSAAALAARGVQVAVLVAEADDGDDHPGVAVDVAPQLFDRGASIDARLALGRERSPAVVHLHEVNERELVRALHEIAPVVASAHGYTGCTSGVYHFAPGEECSRGHGAGCIPNLLARGCAHTRYPRTLPRKYLNTTHARAALRSCDLAVCYSRAIDRHLQANGLAARAIVPLFPTMPARGDSDHERGRRVVFAGRIVRPKGVEVLLDAARAVDAEFVLCGDGRELGAMRAIAEEHGISERVRFTGWLDAAALARELAEASVVAVPSLWPEPFGMVGIEAFAAGRPVVASDTGGIRDWLQDGRNGIAVPPGDPHALASALEALLAAPERQAEMGAAGRQMVAERFTPERHVDALLAAYERAGRGWRAGVRAA